MNFTKKYYELLDETVLFAKHKSGLDVIIIKKQGYTEKYATFSTHFGSINTNFVVPGESEVTHTIDGVAHFLEHKVFEQPDGSNAFDSFAKYGGNANAFTSFGVTNYLFSCTENFYENLAVLLDYVQKPYFTDENVEKEKGIIAQEVRMYDDDPNQVVFYNCLKGLYKNHPVRVEIAGSVEEVMKTTKELLYKCYYTFYNPSNMALILVGDIDENEVSRLVEKYITAEKPDGEIVQVFPDEPEEIVESENSCKMDVAMPIFNLGFKETQVGGSGEELLRRDIATGILLDMLFGRSEKLYNEMYDGGLIDNSFGYYYDYETSFGFAAIVGQSNNIDEVKRRIFAAIDDAKKNGLDRAAFERLKKVYYGGMLRALNDVSDLGNEYMFSFHRGVDYFDYPEICQNITFEYMTERLNVLLDENKSCLSVVEPK